MESRNGKNIKIFLVDDDELNVKLTRFHLRLQGYADVTTYSNGASCLNNLVYNPRVIFLDQHMDDMSGFEVLKKVKETDSSIYVAIFSGEDSPEIIAEFKKQGADHYIVKGPDAMQQVAEVLDLIPVPSAEEKNS